MDNLRIVKHVFRKGTSLYPTYTVTVSGAKEHWDPWNVDLTWNSETKSWDCNDGYTYKFQTTKENRKEVNDLTCKCRTEVQPA